MAPTKPSLHPLATPKTMSFPSELRERTYTCLDPDRPEKEIKKEDEEEITITPPPAYTEFLNTFSPIFSRPATSRENFSKYMLDRPRPSPTSAPTSSTSPSFPKESARVPPPYTASRCFVPLPPKSPDNSRRLPLPPPYVCAPMTDSPRSAHALQSPFTPSDYRLRMFDSPVSDNGASFSVRHVVTTTITLKRAPQLDPPPQGKRRNVTRRNT
ncbi:uncharacterized protein BDW43DRAFT_290406 [Aspergillus alliaceus]|uniref:uncharacterized protein n=1 Tax=Petromyces alliaceus TaxID=209559 RepID=UPI0012A50834|nr:uncharacterized protein BDW43DRAFT_290406 [Aspergillus alliaceus]KAB8228758.1 hypothetical protein BDW43DRAFT_290406 [Aspergillus alliaceus]